MILTAFVLAFSGITTGLQLQQKPEFIPTAGAVYRFIDRMIGEDVFYYCQLEDYPSFKFESYSYPLLQKNLSDIEDLRISMTRTYHETILKISNLKLSDSGSYSCSAMNETSRYVMKLAVHDPAKLLWKFKDRGMKPTRYVELGNSRAILLWSKWMPCDGCAGHGERRRLGFCYVQTKTKIFQCQDIRNLRFHIRQIAKHKKNEILIETCYSECDNDEKMFEPESKITIPVETGDSLEIICPGNITTRTSIRWERQYSTMLRRDFSFGYAPAQPYYITKSNALHINNIAFGNSKIILITCVVWRRERHDFQVALLPITSFVTKTVDHLRITAISCAIQLAMFVILLIVLDTIEAFRESVSVNRTL